MFWFWCWTSLPAEGRDINCLFPVTVEQPSPLGCSTVTLVYGGQPGEDGLAVDECGPEEGCDEVLVLLPEGAELGDAAFYFDHFEAPTAAQGPLTVLR